MFVQKGQNCVCHFFWEFAAPMSKKIFSIVEICRSLLNINRLYLTLVSGGVQIMWTWLKCHCQKDKTGKFCKYSFYSEHKYSCSKREQISDSDTEHE